ncbi:MAG: aspartate aminotransferase family protein [Acidimicrobiales bacterium]
MTNPNPTPSTPSYDISGAEHARRREVIAGGVNSNVRLAGTPVPLTFAHGEGALLWDVDGNEYIDYAAGMGPMVLGHSHPAVVGAVQESLSTGQLFAGQNRLEAEFAEALVGVLPWVESIRIGLTGTEMDLLAVRIARATTGRRRVIRFVGHYHGWLDPLFIDGTAAPEPFGTVPLTAGQSEAAASDVIVCEWNDPDQVADALAMGDVACVLMEPVMCNTGLIAPAPGYLAEVKSLCARHGALLVIDEVITGFRFGLTGAQGRFGVHGDISVYAKAIASGFPLAVLGTTTELLAPVGRGEVNHSGTYNTGVSSLAAGVATIRCLIDTDPYPEMERLTRRLADGLRQVGLDAGVALAVDHVGGSLLQTRFGEDRPMQSRADFVANSEVSLLASFLERLQELGVRPTSRALWFVSAAHDESLVGRTIDAAGEALARL